MKVIFPFAVLSFALLCGCASTPRPRAVPAPAKLYYGTVNIFTDPHRGGTDLVLKKRGYKTTYIHMVLRLEHDTREASERSPQKVVVVMDTE